MEYKTLSIRGLIDELVSACGMFGSSDVPVYLQIDGTLYSVLRLDGAQLEDYNDNIIPPAASTSRYGRHTPAKACCSLIISKPLKAGDLMEGLPDAE